MKRALSLWWSFLWRYAIIFVILLFLLAFFSGVQNGIYIEVITSPHLVIDAINKSDLDILRIINLVNHLVSSFLAILWMVKRKVV